MITLLQVSKLLSDSTDQPRLSTGLVHTDSGICGVVDQVVLKELTLGSKPPSGMCGPDASMAETDDSPGRPKAASPASTTGVHPSRIPSFDRTHQGTNASGTHNKPRVGTLTSSTAQCQPSAPPTTKPDTASSDSRPFVCPSPSGIKASIVSGHKPLAMDKRQPVPPKMISVGAAVPAKAPNITHKHGSSSTGCNVHSLLAMAAQKASREQPTSARTRMLEYSKQVRLRQAGLSGASSVAGTSRLASVGASGITSPAPGSASQSVSVTHSTTHTPRGVFHIPHHDGGAPVSAGQAARPAFTQLSDTSLVDLQAAHQADGVIVVKAIRPGPAGDMNSRHSSSGSVSTIPNPTVRALQDRLAASDKVINTLERVLHAKDESLHIAQSRIAHMTVENMKVRYYLTMFRRTRIACITICHAVAAGSNFLYLSLL